MRKTPAYQAWNDGTISLRDYLTYAASQNWIDVSALTQDDAYLDSQEVYQKLDGGYSGPSGKQYNICKKDVSLYAAAGYARWL